MIIHQVEDDPYYVFAYDYTVTEQFAEDIKTVVNAYYGISPLQYESSQIINTRYTLQDSVPIGSWNPRFRQYNCYSYALGITTTVYDPGEIVYGIGNSPLSLSSDMDDQVRLIVADLEYLGYHCISESLHCPNYAIMSDGFRAICYRVGDYDYHFMRMDSSYWSHKPGKTQPLRYKYTPTQHLRWSNEYQYEGRAYEGYVYYTSQLRFITYCIPSVQYIYDDWHGEYCPGCDTIIRSENCSNEYTYCGSLDIGDCHHISCVICGHVAETNTTVCRFQWRYYGVYNGVASHAKMCQFCGHQGSVPEPCVYDTPGMCNYCG